MVCFQKFIALPLFAPPESFHDYEPVRSINKYQGRLSLVMEEQRLQGI